MSDYINLSDDKMNEFYRKETRGLLRGIGKDEVNRLFSYDKCEIDVEFIAFLSNYEDLKRKVPKDFTIIDVGCYMAMQGYYYKDFKKYIGVEPFVQPEYRLKQDNAEYYNQDGRNFVKETLPKLIKQGLDLNKSFAICSAVPDKEVQKIVAEVFPFHRVSYPMRLISEKIPKIRRK